MGVVERGFIFGGIGGMFFFLLCNNFLGFIERGKMRVLGRYRVKDLGYWDKGIGVLESGSG